MSSAYFLKLDRFEGPLDLLLHLIKVNEIDIFNIDILLLTTQYLEYLRLMRFQDLSDAGEFIEMAATLIEIKSRMLLPNEKRSKNADEADDDPRKSLQERLIEYERIRLAATFLSDRPQFGVQIQTSSEWQRLAPFYEDIEAPLVGDPATLVILFEQMLRQLAERKPTAKVQATTNLVSVEEKITEISKLLQTLNYALFQGFYAKFNSRYELVVYILAVLELSKWGKIKVYQQELMGPIWIYRSDFDVGLLPLTNEEKQRLIQNVTLPQPEPATVEAKHA